MMPRETTKNSPLITNDIVSYAKQKDWPYLVKKNPTVIIVFST